MDLALDLSHLDKATAAHEATVGALLVHLSGRGVEARTHAPGAPAFDAGWSSGADVFITEIKSLTGAREDQQIRLGIGQVLDYAHQLQTSRPGHRVHPVLVLEKRPVDPLKLARRVPYERAGGDMELRVKEIRQLTKHYTGR